MNIVFNKHRHDKRITVLAGLFSLLYMWGISLTSLRQTGLQFVAPLLVIFLTHTVWCFSQHGIIKNSLVTISRQSANTAFSLLLLVGLANVLIPEPAHGTNIDEFLTAIPMFLVCLLMIVIVVVIFAAAITMLIRFVKYMRGPEVEAENDDHNKLNEFASIVLVVGLLVGASLEGVKGVYTFNAQATARASQLIYAEPSGVWQTLETATQPEFSIPSIIAVFPRPAMKGYRWMLSV